MGHREKRFSQIVKPKYENNHLIYHIDKWQHISYILTVFTGAIPFLIHTEESRNGCFGPSSMWNSRNCHYCIACFSYFFALRPLASSEDVWHRFHLSITELFISRVRDSREEEAPRTVVTGIYKRERKVAIVADNNKRVIGVKKNIGIIIYVNSVFLQVTFSFVIRYKGTLL